MVENEVSNGLTCVHAGRGGVKGVLPLQMVILGGIIPLLRKRIKKADKSINKIRDGDMYR